MVRKIWVPKVSGPLEQYATGYASWLKSRAYSPWASADRLYQFDQLSRWLGRQGLAGGDLSEEHVESFAADRRAAGVVTWSAPRSALMPLVYLREVGVASGPAPVVAEGPLEQLLADYMDYLFTERGLSEHTVFDAYQPAARLFLTEQAGYSGRFGLEELSAADVSAFLIRESPKRSVSGGRDLTSALRVFLRYLHLAGWIGAPLVWAVPPVAGMGDRSLPRGLDPADVKKLLSTCDRRKIQGRRDFAILLLMARLGLRAGEVAALELDDIDWRAGHLVVRGKGSRQDVLPLPDDLGQALAAYLQRRPRSEHRTVFLRVNAPLQGLDRCTIGWVVRAACDRAGLARIGPHRLRHTAATDMLQAGASLAEIGEVLRHREQKTTAIYAKVDTTALRALARQWPAAAGGLA